MRFSNFVSDPNDVEKIRGFNCIGLRLEDLQLTASNILYCVTIVILILFCSNTNCKLARVVSPTLNANFFLCVGGGSFLVQKEWALWNYNVVIMVTY